MSPRPDRRLGDALLLALFAAFLCLPGLSTLARLAPPAPGADPPQALSLAGLPLAQQPAALARHIDGNFGLRDWLIRWNNLLRLTLFGEPATDAVVLGKDGWLFYRSEAAGDGNSFTDFTGRIPLTEDELHRAADKLAAEAQAFADRGIAYVAAVAPSKHTACADKLQDDLRRFKGRTRLEQLADLLRTRPKLPFLDLRQTLAQADPSLPLYLQTDSHWNDYAALLAYNAILRRLAERLPALSPFVPILLDKSAVRVFKRPVGGDVAKLLWLSDRITESYGVEISLPEPPAQKPLRKVLFRADSFGDAFYRFLGHHFEKVEGLPPFAAFDFAKIDADPPQAVIRLFSERYIPTAVFDDFEFDRRREGAFAGRR